MKIELVSQRTHEILRGIQEKYPNLTYQNEGYDYPDKSKWSEKDMQAHRIASMILHKHVGGFSEFNHFTIKEGNIAIRLQYNYSYNDEYSRRFVGVGYLRVDELVRGFLKEEIIL